MPIPVTAPSGAPCGAAGSPPPGGAAHGEAGLAALEAPAARLIFRGWRPGVPAAGRPSGPVCVATMTYQPFAAVGAANAALMRPLASARPSQRTWPPRPLKRSWTADALGLALKLRPLAVSSVPGRAFVRSSLIAAR